MGTDRTLIIGAGIGGLAAALSLHAAGIPSAVVERSTEIGRQGLGLNLLPHAVRELTELGFGAELAAIGLPIAENVYLDETGRRLWSEARGLHAGYHWPQYAVDRGRLRRLLFEAVQQRLGPEAIALGHRLAGFVETPSGVRAELRTEDGGRRDVAARVLIGADGVQSAVLAALLGPVPLRWSGVRTWRGMTLAPPFLTGRSMILVNGHAGARLIAYPVSEPHPATGLAAINWVGMVRVADAGTWPVEASWSHEGRLDDVLAHYAGWDLEVLDVRALIEQSKVLLEYPMVDRDPLPRWGIRRVALLGDAAHLMYPVGANGATQAIVDARTLAYHAATSTDPALALRRYEAARRPATSAAVEASRAMDRTERAAAQSGKDAAAYEAIASAYRLATAGDVNTLNHRESLSPPQS